MWKFINKWLGYSIAALGVICLILLMCYSLNTKTENPVFHESMTVQEIKENMPRKYGYILTRHDYKMCEGFQDDVFYVKDGKLFALESASISINSSCIEDGMIYTSTREVQEDGTILERIYINEPYTLELISMGETIKDEDRDLYLLYTIMDKNGFTWYDKHNSAPKERE